MAGTYWWEQCMLGLFVAGYVVLVVNALINRRSRLAQTSKSKIMNDCERCSVEMVRNIVPDAAVPEYRFRGMRLKMSAIHIGFEKVGVKLNSDGRCILEGVTGEFRPKKMAAIMGPSGAGKTTFMNAICGRAYYGTVTGQIRVNGKVSSIAEIKQLRGFVPQDDIVHEQLTVREQIYYSARLRNAEGTPKAAIEHIVEDVLNVMQLLDVQHSIVGDVEKRGISGGQRKRVNIGLELASRPTILMLDEPTSGLDSTTALDIIRSLKRLTAIGMTVVMVVHQPRYSLFTLFDEVLLLGLGGRTVYLDSSEGVLPYFTGLGFKMPEHENPADWFMDVISGKVKNEANPGLKSSGLAEVWNEKMDGVQEQDVVMQQRGTREDKFTFAKCLEEKLTAAGLGGADQLTKKQFLEFLSDLGIEKPCDAAAEQLMERIGFQEGVVTKQRLSSFLFCLMGSFSQDALSDVFDSNLDMGYSEASEVSEVPDGKSSGRRGRFFFQYPVLVHQNSIRWARHWRHKVFSTALIMFSACVFGQQARDKLSPDSVLCPIKINISHVAIGELTGVAVLAIFGSDRPVFWRESASGIGVTAFFLARVTVYAFDVLLWTYAFTAAWALTSSAPCPFWLWLIAFRMTAVSAAGIGVLMSTLVPKQSSTLATSVVILIAGGAVSEPQVVADARGFTSALAFLSPFTWAAGENYLAVIASMGGEEMVNYFAIPMMDGYKRVLESVGGGSLDYLTASYISCGVFGSLSLIFGYLGLRFSHRGRQV
ncbi:unnamed protein product [Effrenium voratum]|uniref:ABC transporter domain-containing protein n=1 Tax=Effrenium voratum TaxID=2562239 RepID=A0AA36IKT0_9DINO|nr:unnamed protein product [Effrenium voratum]CAJ1389376.1 unnamed protein product [Effrenium voratum]CAJ1426302.1 unnamed protein product [Effrenium voratum]